MTKKTEQGISCTNKTAIEKDDFKYGDTERYLKEVYVYEGKDYLLTISEDFFDDESIEYANEIVDSYLENKNNLLNEMLDKGLREFYQNYSYTDEFIKGNMGQLQIQISFKNKGNTNWKFNYVGKLVFLEHNLELTNSISFDG